MKILYCEDEEETRKGVSTLLESELEIEVLLGQHAYEGIELLKRNSEEIKLIISDYMMEGGNGDLLYKYAQENHPELPFIFISSERLDVDPVFKTFLISNPKNKKLGKPFIKEELLGAIEQALDIHSIKDHEEYYRIKLDKLLDLTNFNCDFFLRLGNQKFVKVINSETEVDLDFLERLNNKGVNFLYVKIQDYADFIESLSQLIIFSLEEGEQGLEEAIKYEELVYKNVIDNIKELGVSQENLEFIDRVMETQIKIIEKEPNLLKLFESVKGKDEFFFQHAHLISYVGSSIALNLSYGSTEVVEKIFMAALFHDLELEENDTELEYLKNPQAGVPKNKHFTDHPAKAASKVGNQKGIPNDVDKIILCHHEHPDGIGFPRGLDAKNIPPLAALFILSERIVGELYDVAQNGITKQQLLQISDKISIEYNKGNFKTPLKAFIDLVVRGDRGF